MQRETATTEDGELLAAYARSGDREALAELARRRLAEAYRIALRALGDAAAAEDAAQEAFVGLVRRARSFDASRPFGPWFRALVLNAARMQDRSRARRRRHEGVAAGRRPVSVQDPQPLPERELHQKVRELPLELRFPVILHFLEGLSHEEVGAALSCAKTTARERIKRGLDRLRASFASAGLACTAAELERLLVTTAARPVAAPPVPPVAALEAAARKLVLPALASKAVPAVAAAALVLAAAWASGRFFLEERPRVASTTREARAATTGELAPSTGATSADSPSSLAAVEKADPGEKEKRPLLAPGPLEGPEPAGAGATGGAREVPLASLAAFAEQERRPSPYPWKGSPAGEVSRKLASRKLTLNFPGVPLAEALDLFRDFVGVAIEVDPALSRRLAGQTVELRLRNATAASALTLVLAQLEVDGRPPCMEVLADRIRIVADPADAPFGTRAFVEAVLGSGPDSRDSGADLLAQLAATKVTISLTGPLSELVAYLEDVTGCNVVLARGVDANAPFALELADRPALEALEALAKAAGLAWEQRDGAVVLRPEREERPVPRGGPPLGEHRVSLDLRGANVEDLVNALGRQGVPAVAAEATWSSPGTFSVVAHDEPLGDVVARISSTTPLRAWIGASSPRALAEVVALSGRVPSVEDALGATVPESFTGVVAQLAELRAKLTERLAARRAARSLASPVPHAERETWAAIEAIAQLASHARGEERAPDALADTVACVEQVALSLERCRKALREQDDAVHALEALPESEERRKELQDRGVETQRRALEMRKLEARLDALGCPPPDSVASARRAAEEARARKARLEAGGRLGN
ncbi:sigma-70 family RNA polymerase sigma factor [bacterium]|nr:sigma-70 family RNA polymerase sigma factor [bacterium]